MILVNLPVRDLAASTTFYVALGGTVNPQFSDGYVWGLAWMNMAATA
jgi:predicted lactoylglutathione lyase